ncbi:MAG: isochorismatase family protein [Erythrobacter sp.]
MPKTALDQNYSGAFDGQLSPGDHPALLVVDLVVAYSQPDSPLFCETAAAAIECNFGLVEAARSGENPVVFTNVEYEPGGANGGVFYRKVPSLKCFDKGSPLGAFPDGLDVRPGETVTKQYPSAFFGTNLAERLHAQGVDTLVITGFSTSGCVRASALDALQNGFIPVVVRQACADRHNDPHEANLFDLQAKYAEVVDADAARQILARRSP